MKYGENLKFTDRDFYYTRIKKEFMRKDIITPEEIRKAYEVCSIVRTPVILSCGIIIILFI
jgi:hypothetical protein